MRMTYVAKIQANLKRYQTVHTKRATGRILDGTYRSIFKGRSMNFDELREYVPGDDIKDMDWKASARSQKLLVRQYIAEKRHNVMLVFDTNKRMLGDSDGLEEKRELAIMSAGTFGYFVDHNGDYISATFATKDGVKHFPIKTGLGNLELILEQYQQVVTAQNDTSINETIEYILHHFKRRMILLLVTDTVGILKIDESNLKRLLVAYDVLFINISDADLQGKQIFKLSDNRYLPAFFTKDKKLASMAKEKKMSMQAEATEKLKRFGIACSTVDYADELDREMLELLKKHEHH